MGQRLDQTRAVLPKLQPYIESKLTLLLFQAIVCFDRLISRFSVLLYLNNLKVTVLRHQVHHVETTT